MLDNQLESRLRLTTRFDERTQAEIHTMVGGEGAIVLQLILNDGRETIEGRNRTLLLDRMQELLKNHKDAFAIPVSGEEFPVNGLKLDASSGGVDIVLTSGERLLPLGARVALEDDMADVAEYASRLAMPKLVSSYDAEIKRESHTMVGKSLPVTFDLQLTGKTIQGRRLTLLANVLHDILDDRDAFELLESGKKASSASLKVEFKESARGVKASLQSDAVRIRPGQEDYVLDVLDAVADYAVHLAEMPVKAVLKP